MPEYPLRDMRLALRCWWDGETETLSATPPPLDHATSHFLLRRGRRAPTTLYRKHTIHLARVRSIWRKVSPEEFAAWPGPVQTAARVLMTADPFAPFPFRYDHPTTRLRYLANPKVLDE